MIFFYKFVPMGFYRIEDKSMLPKYRDYILQKEQELMKLNLTWENEDNSPTSARYKNYNFLGDNKLFMYDDEVPAHFRAELKKHLDEFYQRLGWPKQKRWLQCWVNIHRKGHFLRMHTHDDCKMSGHMTITCNNSRTTYVTSQFVEILNEPGIITFIGKDKFPHGTSMVEDDEPRISVAFDLYESEEKLRDHWISIDE